MSRVYEALKLAEERRASAAAASRLDPPPLGGSRLPPSHLRLAFLQRWPLRKRAASSVFEMATLQKLDEIGNRIDRLEGAMARSLAAELQMKASIEARLQVLEHQCSRASGSHLLKPIAAMSMAFGAALIALYLVGR